jgi:mannose/fructose-specific phosphotransferase system component IIA
MKIFGEKVFTRLSLMATAIFLAGCAGMAHYTHDLPEIYRSATFEYGQAETVKASQAALLSEGYVVAFADTVSGIVFTEAQVVPPKNPEIGGDYELVCLLRAVQIQDKTLVTAEIVAQAAKYGRKWPISVDRGPARDLYRSLFRKIQASLESGQTSPP